MARRRFRYDKQRQEMVEVFDDGSARAPNGDHFLWGDSSYKDMRATDGTDISTRTKHREYMRTNGLGTIDDFKETFAAAEKRRDAYRTTGKGGATTAADVARAIESLERRR